MSRDIKFTFSKKDAGAEINVKKKIDYIEKIRYFSTRDWWLDKWSNELNVCSQTTMEEAVRGDPKSSLLQKLLSEWLQAAGHFYPEDSLHVTYYIWVREKY